ncbi:MAG: biopolymer transporter ExbD [Parachlamydiales bacterium]|jgi:biopolymer transport protein ExbD
MSRRKIVHVEEAADESFLNLTPLIDIVLVVLVAFVLIAPLIEVDQVDLAGGSVLSREAKISAALINIYVKEDNTVMLNQKALSFLELKAELERLKALYPDETPKLFEDKKSAFGTYQEVKNMVEELGFARMDVILKSS